MKAIGLVVEYNPLHNGHLIHIAKAKELDSSAILVAVMSPNFVQRGEVSILPKQDRVKAALDAGVDLIVELPTLFAVESADIFASSALKILSDLDVKDMIFGTESGNSEEFIEHFKNKDFASPRMDELIEEYMDEGFSYPKAKALALEQVANFYLENPNDILGYAYLAAIEQYKFYITPHCYKRINNEKGETIFTATSAFTIRQKLKEDVENRSKYNFLDDYFTLLKYKLITTSSSDLAKIHMIDEGIENLFKKNIFIAKNMDEFIKLSTSKRYSSARIKRSIIHILLNTQKDEAKELISKGPSYVRVLGYNDSGRKYLASLRKKENINIVTRFSARDNPMLLDELKATSLYFINKEEPDRSSLIDQEKTLFPIIK